MSFSQITSVDLIVNQIVTIVTKYSPSSPAGIHALGDIVPAETVVRTSSNVGVNQIRTRPELSNTVQVYNPLYSFSNQTFNYSNSPLPDIKSQLSITQPVNLGNRPFGFNIIGNATPVVDTGTSYGGKSFLFYNNLSTVASLYPVLELINKAYYNYSRLYFNGGLNIPYGDITSNVLASGSPVNTYTNISGNILPGNASILTTSTIDRVGRFDQSNVTVISATLQPGSVATQADSQVLFAELSQDIRSNHISGYIAQYAVGAQFPYYDLVSIPAVYNTANYSVPVLVNQTINFDLGQKNISSQRYFVPNSATVNSVTNNQALQQTIIVNAQPEFMLVNSDKNFVASNTAPGNYQTIQPVTPDNDPRLAAIKSGFIVKGETGTNPYNPQNIY